jgi:hypothetical protein
LPRGPEKILRQRFCEFCPFFVQHSRGTPQNARTQRFALAKRRSGFRAVLVPSAKLISAADAARPPRRLPEPATMPAIGIRPRPPNIPHAKSKGIAVEGRPAAVSNESEAGFSGGRRREGECVCTLMRSDTGQQKRRGGRNYRLTHRYPFPSIQSRPPAQALGPRAGQSILSDFTKSSTACIRPERSSPFLIPLGPVEMSRLCREPKARLNEPAPLARRAASGLPAFLESPGRDAPAPQASPCSIPQFGKIPWRAAR